MKINNSRNKEKKETIKAMELVWDSLRSHLGFCLDMKRSRRGYIGSKKFHKEAVREYVFILKVLAEKL